ncbi:MAG: alpha/beta hydrolase [Akkermansiaceae bacterium]|nr:alpha/beta hydrolase [Akkermansiaceae bacterium]
MIRKLGERLDSMPDDEELRLATAEMCEDMAEEIAATDPARAIGLYCAAAETAFPVITRRHGSVSIRSELIDIYNESCAEAAVLFYRTAPRFEDAVSFDGPFHSYRIEVSEKGRGLVSPGGFDQMHSASVLRVKGFGRRQRLDGVGGALVGYKAASAERLEANPFMSPFGMAEPITATIDFTDSDRAKLRFHDVLVDDRAYLAGRSVALAADFTASLATLEAHEPKENIGWRGMLHPDQCRAYQGLYLLHDRQPGKIPLVLVHGLMSSPDTWRDAVAELSADPVLRENYQILLYEYPTGFPIPHNASGLRHYLTKFGRTFDPDGKDPSMRRTVIVGHSMGGLLASMQIRHGGKSFWLSLRKSGAGGIEGDDGSARSREALKEMVYFEPLPSVSRAIFVCAPHRGSGWADNPLGALGAFLADKPFEVFDVAGSALGGDPLQAVELTGEENLLETSLLYHPSNGIRDLHAHSEVLETVAGLPVGEGIRIHSIIGNRGRAAPRESSSDGVVEYWSSHLEGAESERMVPSGHVGATRSEETIDELRRILYLHIGRRFPVETAASAR